MKQIYSKMLLLIAMILVGGSAWAQEQSETLYFTSTKNTIEITSSGAGEPGGDVELSQGVVTVTSAGGQAPTNKALQIYKTKSMTVSVPVSYVITQVAFTYATSCYPFAEAIAEGLENATTKTEAGKIDATYKPSTPASSFTFTNIASGQTKVNKMTVYYKASGLEEVKVTGVTLSESSITLEEGEQKSLVATVAPSDASDKSLTWGTSNASVATVSNGTVVAVAEGTATITVTTKDGGFKSTCNVTVTKFVEPDEYIFRFATNITGEKDTDDFGTSWSKTSNIADIFTEGYQYISTLNSVSNVYPARRVLGSGVKFGSSSKAGSISFNLKKAVPAKYIIVSAAAYGDAEGQQGFNINGENVSMTTALNKAYCDYVIELDGSDLSTITLAQNEATKGRIYVEYIKVLKDEPKFLKNVVKLIAKNEDSYYATFSSDKVTFFPEDYIVSAVGVENGKLYQFDNEEAFDEDIVEITGKDDVVGYYVPANTGVLVTSLESVVTYYTAEGVTPSNDVEAINMLRPATASMTGDFKFYKLAYGDYTNKKDLGFYYGAADGAAFTCKAGAAYLAVPTASAVKSFALNGEATAIQSVNTTASSSTIYNLNGQRLSQLQKGINIVDGKKLFVK